MMMKKTWVLMGIFSLTAIASFSQSDSSKQVEKIDTTKVGSITIITQKKGGGKSTEKGDNNFNIHINFDSSHKHKSENSNTNWLVFDLGFANYRDNTDYVSALSNGFINSKRPVNASNMTLNTGKSSNVNLWLFMKKNNLVKKVVDLKYGLGLEMYNFRFDNSVSYRNEPTSTVFLDSVSFSKNKLYVGYLTIPLMININANPSKKDGLRFSAGLSAGYLVGHHMKQISSERGKVKYYGNFNLNPWRLAAVAEVGLGPIKLYGSYSLNALHNENAGIKQYPYAVGIRFSKW